MFDMKLVQIGSKFAQHTSVRVGWELKTFNTFFDYWKGTMLSMRKSGKVLAGWTSGNDDSSHTSGCPPTLDSISKSDKAKVSLFVKTLLGDHKHIKAGVKELLVANMMRFWNDFLAIIEEDPEGRYHAVRDHCFVGKVS